MDTYNAGAGIVEPPKKKPVQPIPAVGATVPGGGDPYQPSAPMVPPPVQPTVPGGGSTTPSAPMLPPPAGQVPPTVPGGGSTVPSAPMVPPPALTPPAGFQHTWYGAGIESAPAVNTQMAAPVPPTSTANVDGGWNGFTTQMNPDPAKKAEVLQHYYNQGGTPEGAEAWYAQATKDMSQQYTMDNPAPGDDVVQWNPKTGRYEDPGWAEDPAAQAEMARRMAWMNDQFQKGNINATADQAPDTWTRTQDFGTVQPGGVRASSGPGGGVAGAASAPGSAGTSQGMPPGLMEALLGMLRGQSGAGSAGGSSGPNAGVGTSPIDPANDLRGQVIGNDPSSRLNGLRGMSDSALAGLMGSNWGSEFDQNAASMRGQLQRAPVGFRGVGGDITAQGLQTDLDGGPAINPEDSAQLARFRQMLGQSAEGLASGPSRSAIASQRLSAFDTEAQPMIDKGIKAVGKKAASLGRLGMGQTSIETLEPYTDYLTQRKAMETRLAADTAEGEIADRRNQLSDVRGLVGDEESFGLSRRNEQRGERSYRTGIEEGNLARRGQERDFMTGLAERNRGFQQSERDSELGLSERNSDRDYASRRDALDYAGQRTDASMQDRYNKLGAARGMEQGVADEEFRSRNETRGERGWQEELARYATDLGFRQRQQENDEMGDDFSRSMQLAGLGYGDNPWQALLGGSNSAAGGAPGSMDLLMDFILRQQGGK